MFSKLINPGKLLNFKIKLLFCQVHRCQKVISGIIKLNCLFLCVLLGIVKRYWTKQHFKSTTSMESDVDGNKGSFIILDRCNVKKTFFHFCTICLVSIHAGQHFGHRKINKKNAKLVIVSNAYTCKDPEIWDLGVFYSGSSPFVFGHLSDPLVYSGSFVSLPGSTGIYFRLWFAH